jgi:hypothetical protein
MKYEEIISNWDEVLSQGHRRISIIFLPSARVLTLTLSMLKSSLFFKFVKFGDNDGCMFDYVRIPGGSEGGSVHTSRDR